MDFILNPTLQHRTLASVTIMLWTQDDMPAIITSDSVRILMGRKSDAYTSGPFGIYCSLFLNETNGQPFSVLEKNIRLRKQWHLIEEKVKAKVPKLPLPHFLKEKIADFVQPVGLEILNWGIEHQCTFRIFVGDCLNMLCWTPQGTIDEIQTAEMLIRNAKVDVAQQYRLACVYCLEDHINSLWRQLDGKMFHDKRLTEIRKHEPTLVVFWSYYLEGELARLNSVFRHSSNIYRFLYQDSVHTGNLSGVKHFLQKLTFRNDIFCATLASRRRSVSADENCQIPTRHYTDLFCMLLSLMDQTEQFQVIKNNPLFSLTSFLDWPWQGKFMEVFQCVQSSLDSNGIFQVALRIGEKIKEDYTDYDYCGLFAEFWLQSCSEHKEDAIKYVLCLLMDKSDDNFKLILEHLTTEEKEILIFCDGEISSGEFIHGVELCLLRMYVSTCSSKDEVIVFKENFIAYVLDEQERSIHVGLGNNKSKWDYLFKFWKP